MDFSGRIILSFIEEDNTQRAYFRVRPLLGADGAVAQADIDALPDDGYLRVVPDKNEQHTFKDRMRELEPLCVLDLVNLPPEAVKIRSNKNYAPQRGENNQFIVYSDAVQPIPQQLFYEVISAEAGEKEKISRAATPLCYLRSGGRIYGPVSRATGLEQEGAAPLAPDSDGLYAVTLPDGAERLFYWPRKATVKPVAAEADVEQEEALAVQAEAQRRLNGMPLYQTVARRPAVQQRAHNSLADTVDRQLHAGRVEAPGAVLNAGTGGKPVENPMDAFKRALSELWVMPDMQRQAAAQFLSMTGVRNVLDQQLVGSGVGAVAEAMNGQIQDLEAERLALIMQVEAAKKDLNTLRRDALEQANQEDGAALERARQALAALRADTEQLEVARAGLIAERDAALQQMAEAGEDTVWLAAQAGGYADLNTLCERVQKSLNSVGIACGRDEAIHLLALLCVCPAQIEIEAETIADSLAAAQAFARALGVEAGYDEGMRAVRVQAGGDSFRLLVTHDGDSKADAYTRLIVNAYTPAERSQIYDASYALNPWPIAKLGVAAGWHFEAAQVYPPVKAEAVRDALTRDRSEVPAAALKLLEEIAAAVKETAPLPAQLRQQIYEYLSITAGLLSGGIAAALDLAVSAWIVPYIRRCGADTESLRALAQGLPRTRALLGAEHG